MAIQGLRDTSNFATDERPKNYREGMLHFNPQGSAPLTALSSLMKKRKVDDPEFYWWEKRLQSRRVALNAAIATTGVTTVTLVSGAKGFKQGDLLYVEATGEILAVTADPTTDVTLSVARGFAGTTAATVTIATAGTNPNITCIGSAYEQGSLAPTGVNFDPAKVYNYCQIFRQTLEMTRTASKTRLRTGDQVKEAKREAMELLFTDIERAFLMGKKTSTTQNGKPLYTMDGFENSVDVNNIVTADTATGCTMEALEGYLERIFRYGSSEKMAFTGNVGLLTINQIIRKNTTWQIQSGLKEAGMTVSRLICPFGELVLKTHPLLNLLPGGTVGGTPYYARNSWLYVMDMANVQFVTFQDDDIKYQADLQNNGMDGMKSGFLGEISIEFHQSESHFLIKNLGKAAKDA